MSSVELDPTAGMKAAESSWHSLYKIGGAACLAMALFIPVQVIVFILWPPPSTVTGWFTLFQESKLVGLLDLDLLLIVDQVLMIPVFLALFFSLRDTDRSFMILSVALGLIGTATYFASGSAFEMLSLSGKYSTAITEAEKSMLLTAGQIAFANWQGTAFDISYVLQGIAFLTASLVMLKSVSFGKATAIVGIVGGVMMLLPPTAGIVGLILSLGSLVPLEIWDIMVGKKFIQMSA